LRDKRFAFALEGLWVVTSLVMIYLYYDNIAARVLSDPDDYMRLLQVRDLLAGQSWFDLHQHRLVPPLGPPMHWSRLVDLPLAAAILLLRPFVGTSAAEQLATILIPMVTLGCVMALVAAITRRLLGTPQAYLAAALVPTAPLLWVQLQPLRIDHHGWQVVAALAMTLLAIDPHHRRGGAIAGLAAATALNISFEAAPFVAAVGGLFAWRWVKDDRPALLAFALVLAATSLLYFVAMQPVSEWRAAYCDVVAAPYLAGLVVIAAGVAVAVRLHLPASARLTALGAIAIAGAGAVMLVNPACGSGQLVRFDPIVYHFWFRNFAESLPVWEQSPLVATMIVGIGVIGIIGSWRARARAAGEARQRWTNLLLLQIASMGMAMLVQRAGATESALALPGTLSLITELQDRFAQVRLATLRVLGSTAAILLCIPATLPATVKLLSSHPGATARPAAALGCSVPSRLAAISTLPTANVASTFDLSATILTVSEHRVLATGHHRNMSAMRDLIVVFTADPAVARAVLERRDIRYVILCRDSNEVSGLASLAPKGLMNRLLRGDPPPWLRRIRLRSAPELDVWLVMLPGRPPLRLLPSATPAATSRG
jgi:hypothetical protein